MKILHLGSSSVYDKNFMLATELIFEKAFPNQNIYYLFNDSSENFQISNDNFYYKVYSKELLEELLEELNTFDLVILHNLNKFKSNLVLKYKNPNLFIWVFWGYEFYHNENFYKNELLSQHTVGVRFKYKSINYYLSKLIYTIFPSKSSNYLIKNAIKKINYIATFIDEEIETLKSKNAINNSAIKINYSYYPIDYIIKDVDNTRIYGNNILIGNSAAPTNNHLEVFSMLKNFDTKNIKLITPLSYGDLKYSEIIKNEGYKLFGDNFQPLTEFLPLKEYNDLIKTCSIYVQNSYRQLAVGNILSMIYSGAKVFLNERNNVFKYLKRIGCIVFSTYDLISEPKNTILGPLRIEEKEKNRNIILEYFSLEILANNIQNSIKNIKKNVQ